MVSTTLDTTSQKMAGSQPNYSSLISPAHGNEAIWRLLAEHTQFTIPAIMGR